jgi:hypothetical protein
MDVTLYRRYFSVGYFEEAVPGAPFSTVNVPTIVDHDTFMREVFAAWHRGLARLGMD